jgi:hypothetical protein
MDPSRIVIDRLHKLSTGFFAIEIAAAAIILVTTARLLRDRSGAAPAPVPAASRPPIPKVLDLSGL